MKELTNFVLKVSILFCALSFEHLVLHYVNLMMSFQIGLLTGICLTAILGVSFGSLAGVFTQDLKVLQVARTGVLVCMILLVFCQCFFAFVSMSGLDISLHCYL